MVLVGQVNTELVGFINKLGGKAVGLSGVSGDIYHCHQRDEVHGYVGDIDYVHPKPLFAMLAPGYIPAIAPTVRATPSTSTAIPPRASSLPRWALKSS